MKIWVLILLLLSCVVGFAASYGFAYRQINGVLYSSAITLQDSSPASVNK